MRHNITHLYSSDESLNVNKLKCPSSHLPPSEERSHHQSYGVSEEGHEFLVSTQRIRVSYGILQGPKKRKGSVTCLITDDEWCWCCQEPHRGAGAGLTDRQTAYQQSYPYLTENQQAPLPMANCIPLCLFFLQLMVIWLALPGPGRSRNGEAL